MRTGGFGHKWEKRGDLDNKLNILPLQFLKSSLPSFLKEGIAFASQTPLEKGEKGGIWTTSGNCHCFTTPLEKGGKGGIWATSGKRKSLSHKWERGDLSHKWEGGIWATSGKRENLFTKQCGLYFKTKQWWKNQIGIL